MSFRIPPPQTVSAAREPRMSLRMGRAPCVRAAPALGASRALLFLRTPGVRGVCWFAHIPTCNAGKSGK